MKQAVPSLSCQDRRELVVDGVVATQLFTVCCESRFDRNNKGRSAKPLHCPEGTKLADGFSVDQALLASDMRERFKQLWRRLARKRPGEA